MNFTEVTFQNFGLTFIPIFVAIDVLGILPIFIGMTRELDQTRKKKLIRDATFTAGALALIFTITGKFIFQFLGITENDFRIGGGIILLVLSITDLLFSSDTQRTPVKELGIVPIGIPLIMGPAALTSVMIITDQFGYFLTILSLILNLVIVLIVLRNSDLLLKYLGNGGSRAVAKIASLLMTAIAVMMIRVGIMNILK
ncbi:MAG: MarC family protein [Ignavibacteria bacterium]|nr:MarC family protein [Ignavibacteria bacterium]